MTGMAIAGGLTGALIGAEATSANENPGPVDLVALDEASARSKLAELQQAE
jgi:hypothetical protein